MQLARERVAGGTLPRSASRTASGSPSPKTHGVPEGLCRCGPARRLCRPHTHKECGVRYCRSNERCGPPERSGSFASERPSVAASGDTPRCIPGDAPHPWEMWGWRFVNEPPVYFANEIRAKPEFAQPEVWPTPAGRTGLHSMTNRRDNRQHHYASARVAAKVCCNPVVVGPRTDKSVRLADRRGKTGLSDPSRTEPKGSLRSDSTRGNFRRLCMPRTGLAIPRTFRRSGRLARVLRPWRTAHAVWRYPAHHSRAHCLRTVSRAAGASCELAIAGTEVSAR